MLRNVGRIAWNSIVILLGGALLGMVLLAGAFFLPVSQKNFEESISLIKSEDWYPLVPQLAAGGYFGDFFPGVLDNSSDCIMLHTAMDDSEGGLLQRAMNMYSDYSGYYSYYWHGYVSVLRPLCLLFNYSDIRTLNGMLQLLLLLLLAGTIEKKLGIYYLPLLVTSYFLLMPAALGFALQYSWVFYIGITTCMALLRHQSFFEKENRILYAFLVCGMLTSYFDLLTYPLFTWGFPMAWWVLCSRASAGGRKNPAVEKLGAVIGGASPGLSATAVCGC